jgi:hypothetical protein
MIYIYIYIYTFNRSWLDTRWQKYITHLHKNSTHNTEKGKLGSERKIGSLHTLKLGGLRNVLTPEHMAAAEADLISVSSAEFKKTWCRTHIFPIYLYAVHRNSRNATYNNNIVIRPVKTFII